MAAKSKPKPKPKADMPMPGMPMMPGKMPAKPMPRKGRGK